MNGGARPLLATTPSLAICIPTYNFAETLGPTLDSIIEQSPPDLEIVVLDGGSTDDTAHVVHQRMQQHTGLRYVKREKRGGIDRDMALSVELAHSDYCWLFSADDLMLPDALAHVLQCIQSADDVYLAGFTLATRDMRPLREHPVLSVAHPRTYEFGDASQRLEYAGAALTTVAFFSFMGSLVVNRRRWCSVPIDEAFVGSCWAHVARLFRLAQGGLRVHYLARSLMLKRADNDSFMDRGAVHRLSIAVDGYHRLADVYFGHGSLEAMHIRRVLRAEFGPYALLYIKLQAVDSGTGELDRLDSLVRKLYSDPGLHNYLRRLIFKCVPLVAFRGFRNTLRFARKLIRR